MSPTLSHSIRQKPCHWLLRCTLSALLLLGSAATTMAAPSESEVVALHQTAKKLEAAGRLQPALASAHKAVQLGAKVFGTGHETYAALLSHLAWLHARSQAFKPAIKLFKQALAINEARLGKDHRVVAMSATSLGRLYDKTGDYPKAAALFEQALGISERTAGKDSPAMAESLADLAIVYQTQRRLTEALALQKRALAIRKATLGDKHPLVARALNNLAGTYFALGSYAKVAPLLEKTIAIDERGVGRDHPNIALSLNNLGALYKTLGDYARAEPLFKRALAIDQKQLGQKHLVVATDLNNLGSLYSTMGAENKAVPLLMQAIAIWESNLGKDHLSVASGCKNLADVYERAGNYDTAQALYKRALTIIEKRLGKAHPMVALALTNLAGLHGTRGAFGQAERLYKQALDLRTKALGPEHPDVGSALHDLANLYRAKRDYKAAVPLFKRALKLTQKALGGEHPTVAIGLNTLALVYRSQSKARAGSKSKLPLAEALEKRALGILERHLEATLVLGDEHQKRSFIQTLQGNTYVLVSAAVNGGSVGAKHTALTAILQRHGRLLDAMRSSQRLFHGAAPKLRGLVKRWRDARERLAQLSLSPPPQLTASKVEALRRKLGKTVEDLEEELASVSSAYQAARPVRVTVAAVAKQLRSDEVMVGFSVFKPHTFSLKSTDAQWGKPRYAVWTLTRDEKIRWVDLGDKARIDTAVAAFRRAIYPSAFGAGPPPNDDDDDDDAEPRTAGPTPKRVVKKAGKTLFNLTLGPVQAALAGKRSVVLLADGALNLVPFAALVEPGGKYLVEKYTLRTITSAQEMLRRVKVPSRSGPLLVGGVAFTDPGRAGRARVATRGLSTGRFGPLPGTRAEVTGLRKALGIGAGRVLLESQASEAAVKSKANGPVLLHIATHGFFVPAKARPKGQALPSEELRRLHNPLLRSGLALAGANQPNQGARGDDGILTAFEVTNLNLVGTELVVLSACQTGLGGVQDGEGVYGLRRALALAGARTQVTSLWSVDDGGTMALMGGWYQRLLKGEDRVEAMRQVQLDMIHRRFDVATLGTHWKGAKTTNWSHPFFWAPFVVSGAAGPVKLSDRSAK